MKFTVIQNNGNVLSRAEGDPRSYFNRETATKNKVCWIDIATEDRNGLDDLLMPLVDSSSLRSHLASPGESTRVRVYKDLLFLDLHAFAGPDERLSTYFSLLIEENIVIVISQGCEYVDEMMARWKDMSALDELTPLGMLFGFFDFLLDTNSKVINQLNFKVEVNSKALLGKRIRRDFIAFDELRNEVLLVQEVLENQFILSAYFPYT